MTHPLDNPVLGSLTGPHRRLALVEGRAARYPADVSPFCALPGEPRAADWADAARLVAPGELVLFPALGTSPPYMPVAAKGLSSRKGLPGSRSASTRSRGNSLPRFLWRAR